MNRKLRKRQQLETVSMVKKLRLKIRLRISLAYFPVFVVLTINSERRTLKKIEPRQTENIERSMKLCLQMNKLV